MNDTSALTKKESSALTRQKMMSLVSQLVNGNPNPDDPQPPGPWDPVIRRAHERVSYRMSTPFQFSSWDWVALNPQPLPPRVIFSHALAEEVIGKALLMQEIADGMNTNEEERGIIIVSGLISKFVDDLCPERPKIPFPKKKGPWPPDPDPDPRWQALELFVIALQFKEQSRSTSNEALRLTFEDASDKIISTALSRM